MWVTVGSYANASDAFVDRYVQLLRTNHATVSDTCVKNHNGLFDFEHWMEQYDISRLPEDTDDSELNALLERVLNCAECLQEEQMQKVMQSVTKAQTRVRLDKCSDNNTLAQLLYSPFVLLSTLEAFLNALYEVRPLLTCADNVRTFEKTVEVMSVTCTTLLTLYVADDHRSFRLPVLQQSTEPGQPHEQLPALVHSSLRDAAIGVFLVNLRCHAATQHITNPHAQEEMTALAASVQGTRCMLCTGTNISGVNAKLFAVLCVVPDQGVPDTMSEVTKLRLCVAAHAFAKQKDDKRVAFGADGQTVFETASSGKELYCDADNHMPSYWSAMLECLCLASKGHPPDDRIGNCQRLFT
jgi:hypothetical protein